MYQTIFEVEKPIGNSLKIVRLLFLLHLVHPGQWMKKSLKLKILKLISPSCTKPFLRSRNPLEMVSKLSDYDFPSILVSLPDWSIQNNGWKGVWNYKSCKQPAFVYQTIFEVEKSIGYGFKIVRNHYDHLLAQEMASPPSSEPSDQTMAPSGLLF